MNNLWWFLVYQGLHNISHVVLVMKLCWTSYQYYFILLQKIEKLTAVLHCVDNQPSNRHIYYAEDRFDFLISPSFFLPLVVGQSENFELLPDKENKTMSYFWHVYYCFWLLSCFSSSGFILCHHDHTSIAIFVSLLWQDWCWVMTFLK